MKKVIVVKHIERCGTVSGIRESPGDRSLSVSTMDSHLPWLLGAFDRRSLSSLQLSWLSSLVNTVSIPLRGQGLSVIQRPLCSLCFFKSRLKISKLTKLISSLRSRVFTQNPGSRIDLSSVSEAYTMYLCSSSGKSYQSTFPSVFLFLALSRLPGWLHWLLYSGPDLSRSCFFSQCIISFVFFPRNQPVLPPGQDLFSSLLEYLSLTARTPQPGAHTQTTLSFLWTSAQDIVAEELSKGVPVPKMLTASSGKWKATIFRWASKNTSKMIAK